MITQAFDWYLPMMFHLETLKMAKFFPNTQNLIQSKNPSNHAIIEAYIGINKNLHNPFNLEEENYEVCSFSEKKVMH